MRQTAKSYSFRTYPFATQKVLPTSGIRSTGNVPTKQMKGHTPFLPTKRKPYGLSLNEKLHVPATFHVVFTPFLDT